MNRIITSDRFHQYAEPKEILPLIDRDHPASPMLVTLCTQYPRAFSIEEMMWIGGLHPERMGPVCARAAFFYRRLRINDSLPRTGWRVSDQAPYGLERITADHARMLQDRLNHEVAA